MSARKSVATWRGEGAQREGVFVTAYDTHGTFRRPGRRHMILWVTPPHDDARPSETLQIGLAQMLVSSAPSRGRRSTRS